MIYSGGAFLVKIDTLLIKFLDKYIHLHALTPSQKN